VKGLTLIRPWPWTIVHLAPPEAKRIENRTWRPVSIVGDRIALHAGHGWDASIAAKLAAEFPAFADADHPAGAIVGVATVRCSVPLPPSALRNPGGLAAAREVLEAIHVDPDQAPSFVGPHGLILDDVRALPAPMPCRGGLGLWDVPDHLVSAIRSHLGDP
jgi:hypothetical protein